MAKISFVVILLLSATLFAHGQNNSDTTYYEWTRDANGTVVNETAIVEGSFITISSQDANLPSAGFYKSDMFFDFTQSKGKLAFRVYEGANACFLLDVGILTFDLVVAELMARNGTYVTNESQVFYNGNSPSLNLFAILTQSLAYPFLGRQCILLEMIDLKPLAEPTTSVEPVLPILGFFEYVNIVLSPSAKVQPLPID